MSRNLLNSATNQPQKLVNCTVALTSPSPGSHAANFTFGSAQKSLPKSQFPVVAKKSLVCSAAGDIEQSGFVGLYDFQEVVGKGHFGTVILATHALTKEKVAIKVIEKTRLDEITKARLSNEVRCMQLLNHPNIITLYEVAETPTRLYLILEYAEGGDLLEKLEKQGKFSESMARSYFRQVLSALLFCHQLHVVHRDVKPENLLFCGNHLKVSDFGMSSWYNPGVMMETACGSLGYSAPEILLGAAYEGPAVDVWSLGVTLFIMLSGHLPFDDANPNEAVICIMEGRFTMEEEWSSEVKDLLSRMLVVDPAKRATLQEIKTAAWVRCGTPWTDSDDAAEEELSPHEHNEVMARLAALNLDIEQVQSDLDANLPTFNVATYHLLSLQTVKCRARRRTVDSEPRQMARSMALPQTPSIDTAPTHQTTKGQVESDFVRDSPGQGHGPTNSANTSLTRSHSAEGTTLASHTLNTHAGGKRRQPERLAGWLHRLRNWKAHRSNHLGTMGTIQPNSQSTLHVRPLSHWPEDGRAKADISDLHRNCDSHQHSLFINEEAEYKLESLSDLPDRNSRRTTAPHCTLSQFSPSHTTSPNWQEVTSTMGLTPSPLGATKPPRVPYASQGPSDDTRPGPRRFANCLARIESGDQTEGETSNPIRQGPDSPPPVAAAPVATPNVPRQPRKLTLGPAQSVPLIVGVSPVPSLERLAGQSSISESLANTARAGDSVPSDQLASGAKKRAKGANRGCVVS